MTVLVDLVVSPAPRDAPVLSLTNLPTVLLVHPAHLDHLDQEVSKVVLVWSEMMVLRVMKVRQVSRVSKAEMVRRVSKVRMDVKEMKVKRGFQASVVLVESMASLVLVAKRAMSVLVCRGKWEQVVAVVRMVSKVLLAAQVTVEKTESMVRMALGARMVFLELTVKMVHQVPVDHQERMVLLVLLVMKSRMSCRHTSTLSRVMSI